MRYFYIIIFSLICLNLQGCFSEVESTPKISYKHINTEESNQPKSIISHILNQPFCEWKEGKEFIVTDNKISHILFSKTKADSFLGSSIYFAKYKTITSITGNKSTELVFLSQDGDSLFYLSTSSTYPLFPVGSAKHIPPFLADPPTALPRICPADSL